jgi:pilus assembly protein Flp/PilA
MIARFIQDERGTTAIEYGLIAVLLSVAIIAAVSSVGSEVSGMFGRIEGKVKTATSN